MNIYRKRLLAIPIVWLCIFLYALPLYFKIFEDRGSTLLFICFLLFATIMLSIIGLAFCYLIITDEKLIIRNSLYRFWHKEYVFNEISKIQFCQNNRGGIYLRIYFNDIKFRNYSIECVDTKRLYDVVEDLKKHALKVEIVGLATKQYIEKEKARRHR